MLTLYGKAVRKYRIDRGITLADMAEQLGCSAAYLSAMETGKRNIPKEIVGSVGAYLELADQELSELEELAEASGRGIKLELANASDDRRTLAGAFARRFSELGDDEVESIRKILEGGKG